MSEIIYKYFRVNEFLFDTLISNQLYFSSVNQFNDPYDCYYRSKREYSLDDFNEFLVSLGIGKVGSEECNKAFKVHGDDLVKEIMTLFKGRIEYLGICCLSKSKNSLLMWSHYADSHKGVVLGFDADKMKQQFKQFEDIDYNNDPILFDIKNPSSSMNKTILRKSKHWEYEQEIRFLMERNKNAAFPMDALVEINFGSKCSKRNKQNIIHLVKNLTYTNFSFYEAKIDESAFGLCFDLVDIDALKNDIDKSLEEVPYEGTIDLEKFFD
jgi:hypothetical protein